MAAAAMTAAAAAAATAASPLPARPLRTSAPTPQPLPQHGADPGFASVFASGAGVFWHSAAPGGGMRGHMGKEAVMIPERAAGPAAARLAALRHCGEVQGLALRQLEEGARRGALPAGAGPGARVAGRGGAGQLSLTPRQRPLQPSAALPRNSLIGPGLTGSMRPLNFSTLQAR